MKSTKKAAIKITHVTHTWTKAAMDAANLPEADNPFVTRDELSNVMNALTEDFTDYNYNITEREMITPLCT
jgi:hypothetical protein